MKRPWVLREPDQGMSYERGDDWREQGLCGQADPESWYPPKGSPTANAKAICRACPVTAACLEDALERNERWGVWGGLSLRERNQLAKARREAAA